MFKTYIMNTRSPVLIFAQIPVERGLNGLKAAKPLTIHEEIQRARRGLINASFCISLLTHQS